MSKKAFALVLTVVFVFAFATSAFAAWGDSTYADSVIQGGAADANPHKNYDTTSRKCAVCHAVHNADSTGVRLLRGGTNNPCVTCHIDTNAGVLVVYKGQFAAYDVDSEFAHNNACEDCHTVHGVGATTVLGASGNLKGLSAFNATSEGPDLPRTSTTHAGLSTATNVPGSYSLSQWCSGCHPYLATAEDDVSHVMTTSGGSLLDYATSYNTTQVAWDTSESCTKCHDSATSSITARVGSNATTVHFPHYTDGARFLNTVAAAPVAAGQADLDGVCLKCHVSGTAGVGITY